MNKITLKKQETISMEKFLRDYIEIEDEELINFLSSLPHKKIKTIIQEIYKIQLSCVPFELTNIEDIGNGSVLLVQDSCYHTAPYKNPQKNIDYSIEQYNKINREYFEYEDCIDELESDLQISNIKINTKRQIKIKERKIW